LKTNCIMVHGTPGGRFRKETDNRFAF
jgi:hypothetical protein